MTVLERFNSKYIPVTESGCWLWTDGVDPKGYGRFQLNNNSQYAHRVSWELLRGTIPPPLTIDHLCRVRCCVNPDHMEVVTGPENSKRGKPGKKGAWQLVKTHCPQGHPYDEENTCIRFVSGRYIKRSCKACNIGWAKARYARLKARAS
jgi:hypothetical protein